MIQMPRAASVMSISLALISLWPHPVKQAGFAGASSSRSPQSVPTLEKIGKDYRISNGAVIESLSPSIAYNSVDNEYMVVWFDARNLATTELDIFGQRIAANGDFIGDNFTINHDIGGQFDPSLAYNSIDNNYLVAWESQFDRPGTPDFNHAFAQIMSNNGALIGNRFHLSNGGLELSSAHNSTDNNFFVTGRAFAPGQFPGILGQAVSPLGVIIGGELSLAAGSDAGPNGQVAYNPNANEYLAIWRHLVTTNPTVTGDLEGRRISASGAPVGDPIVISNVFTESPRPTGSIAFDPDADRYLVVFTMFQGTVILAQFVSSSGQLIGSNFQIGTLDSREGAPSVVYSRGLHAYLMAWMNDKNILAGVLAETGGAISNTISITTRSKAAGSPRIALNTRTNDFLVVWPDDKKLKRKLNAGRQDIFAQLIRAS